MIGLAQLPSELLSRIIDFVAVGEQPRVTISHGLHDDEGFSKHKILDNPTYPGLSFHNNMFSITPRPDIFSLRNLRLVSKQFSHFSSQRLFRCVRLLPTEESAARYDEILTTPSLSGQVRKVVFQTRMEPGGSNSSWATLSPGPGDDYTEPHPYFLDALKNVGRFPNLTHVELVFSSTCVGPLWDNDSGHEFEDVDFREQVLSDFYSGLNHDRHPADNVFSLSIKNLQDRTPQALMTGSEDDNTFKRNFSQVMSRITQLGLQIGTEDNEAAPEHTLQIPECHDFFGHELQTYWLAPIAANLVYLKLYAGDIYFGMYPRCNLPAFPKLRTLIFGNLSVTHDDQINWILGHAATLEELIFDDAVIAVGAQFLECRVDVENRRVVYLPVDNTSGRPSYQPAPVEQYDSQKWLYPTRWYHVFTRLQQEMSSLKHFAIGRGRWEEHASYDEGDSLESRLVDKRYLLFDQGSGPDNWLESDGDGDRKAYNDWEDDETDIVYKPDCDEEDWRALNELLDELRRRKCS